MSLDTLFRKDRTSFSILIDPEKSSSEAFSHLLELLPDNTPDVILIGGSSIIEEDVSELITRIKDYTSTPIVLFPGGPDQLAPEADGLLLCSLISGRNPEYLIGKHVDSAHVIQALNIPVWPIGYILVDGYKTSSTSFFTQTKPIDPSNIALITRTALAGQLLGMKAIYLEAGSGARAPVPREVITSVTQTIDCPLIVGGGLRSCRNIEMVVEAGADMVVIGTALEKSPELLSSFLKSCKSFQMV